jgi:hypothetical protein
LKAMPPDSPPPASAVGSRGRPAALVIVNADLATHRDHLRVCLEFQTCG